MEEVNGSELTQVHHYGYKRDRLTFTQEKKLFKIKLNNYWKYKQRDAKDTHFHMLYV